MKTPKRTRECPKCGATATLQWHLYRDYCDEFDTYAAWVCPECGWKSNGIYSPTAIEFARYHRKNRVRQLKHTIARLKVLANMEKPFDETWWEILGRGDEIKAKYHARIALWKAAAKKYRVERAGLDLTEWQRGYLAEYIIQSEIDDQETWLEYAEGKNMKDAIKLRLDALRKLKAFLGGSGNEEGGRP